MARSASQMGIALSGLQAPHKTIPPHNKIFHKPTLHISGGNPFVSCACTVIDSAPITRKNTELGQAHASVLPSGLRPHDLSFGSSVHRSHCVRSCDKFPVILLPVQPRDRGSCHRESIPHPLLAVSLLGTAPRVPQVVEYHGCDYHWR